MIFLLLFYFLFCFVFFVVFFLLVSFLLLFCCCCFGFYKTEERKQLKSIIYDTFFIVFFSNFLTYQTRLPTIKSWNCSGFNVHRVILKPLILLTDCLTGRSQAKSQNTKFLSQSPFWKYNYAPDVIILFNSALILVCFQASLLISNPALAQPRQGEIKVNIFGVSFMAVWRLRICAGAIVENTVT